MSHLSRRYTDYFYREVEVKNWLGKKKKQLKKIQYKALQDIEKSMGYSILRSYPNAVFPCQHEKRGFLSQNGKKSNHTHARYKRRNKARIRARKVK